MEKLTQINWNDSELARFKERTMRRIHWIWFMKKVIWPASFVLAVSGFILVKELLSMNLGIILNNILERVAKLEVLGLANYFLVAVRETEFDSLILILSALALGLFFGRKLIKESANFLVRSSHLIKI